MIVEYSSHSNWVPFLEFVKQSKYDWLSFPRKDSRINVTFSGLSMLESMLHILPGAREN